MMELPAVEAQVEVWRFTRSFARRAEAAEGVAATLAAACREVQDSDVLRTLLRVALLAGEQTRSVGFAAAGSDTDSSSSPPNRYRSPSASLTPAGNFLSAGSRNSFQIDALAKLKDVRSTRAR